MTREELVQMREYQVGAASNQYWNKNKDNDEVSIMTAFEDGVSWADEHPKNPWIGVEEKPKKTDVYYVRTCQGCADMAYFDSSIEKWEKGRFTDGTVTHWMLIPEV